MASSKISRNSLCAILMVLMLFLQVSGLENIDSSQRSGINLSDIDDELFSNPLDDSDFEYGSDIIGQTIEHDGLYNYILNDKISI